MPYYVYILQSIETGRYYVGQTEDLAQRILRHNAGSEKATKPYRPWKIIWQAKKETRAESMLLEKKLKNLSRKRLKQFIEKYSSGE